MKVFLSYSRRDSEFVDRLDRDLSSRGYQVWVDREDIVGGGEDRWRRSTARAIHDSDVMLLVLSPNSVESEHVERELSVAADNRRRVVPVLLRECQIPHGFQYELAGLQYADFSTGGFDEAMHQLAAQLGPPTATGIESPTSPSAPTHVRAPANAPGDVRRRQRILLLLGACTVALVIGATLLVVTLNDDDEASPDTVAPGPIPPPTAPPATDPTTTSATAPPTTAASEFLDAVPVIIDTDANNELDDQHALAYALLRPNRFDLVAITVNATRLGGTVAAHVAEAERVVALAARADTVPVVAGADGTFDEIRPRLGEPDHEAHAAVDAIIAAARADDDLVVIPIGKLTNVALALAKAPDIAAGLRVVWLGSNYPLGGSEYNLDNDPGALAFVLDEGVDAGLRFEIVTVRPGDPTGTAAVRLTLAEAAERMPGLGPVIEPPIVGRTGGTYSTFGDYSADLFRHSVPFGDPPQRSLFDVVGVAIVAEPSWASSVVVPAPLFVDGQFAEQPDRGQTIVYWEQFDRDAIVEDLFGTLAAATGQS